MQEWRNIAEGRPAVQALCNLWLLHEGHTCTATLSHPFLCDE
jgi:hypothetical protein